MQIIALTPEQARAKLARYRRVDETDLHVLAMVQPAMGIKAALLFGVEAVAGIVDGSEYQYTFGAVPPSALTEGAPGVVAGPDH